MDPLELRLWRDDFRREVDQVLAQLRVSPPTPGAASPRDELPPWEWRDRSDRLAQELQAARRRLDAVGPALSRQSARAQRLKALAGKLAWAVKSLEAELKQLRLGKSTGEQDAEQARRGSVEAAQALEASQAEAAQWRERAQKWANDARLLETKVGELERQLARKDASSAALEQRLQGLGQQRQELQGELERVRRAEADARAESERLAHERQQDRNAQLEGQQGLLSEHARSKEAWQREVKEREQAEKKLAGVQAQAERLRAAVAHVRAEADNHVESLRQEAEAGRAAQAQAQRELLELRQRVAELSSGKADLDSLERRLKEAEAQREQGTEAREELRKVLRDADVRERQLREELGRQSESLQREARTLRTKLEEAQAFAAQCMEDARRVEADALERVAEERKAKLAEIDRQWAQSVRGADAELAQDRTRLRALWESDKELDAERARVHAEQEARRKAIADETQASLSRLRALLGEAADAPAAPVQGLMGRLKGLLGGA